MKLGHGTGEVPPTKPNADRPAKNDMDRLSSNMREAHHLRAEHPFSLQGEGAKI